MYSRSFSQAIIPLCGVNGGALLSQCRGALHHKQRLVSVRRAGCTRFPLAGRHIARRSQRKSLRIRAVFEQFTERSIKAVMLSQREAKALGSSETRSQAGAVHILLGLLALDSHTISSYLGQGATLKRARKAVQSESNPSRLEKTTPSDIAFTGCAKRIFEAAQRDASRRGQKFVAPEHLFIAALASRDSQIQQLLSSLSVSAEAAQEAAEQALRGDEQPIRQLALAGNSQSSGAQPSGKALETYCLDLSDAARRQRLDPVVGRQKEIRRTIQILARRAKNNPILLGEPGTGKTAIVEAIALAAVQGRHSDGEAAPEFLKGRRILQLDLAAMLSGSKERGELEKRLTDVVREASTASNVILVIDEIHQIVGAGAVGRTSGFAAGGLDISNLLKPELARGNLQVVGATTLKEYRRHFEKDAALERRFQPLVVNEPTPQDTVAMLRCLQERYEKHHQCVYTEEAISAAVLLSVRYITDRWLPDKAIDLLDEAGSRARITAFGARQQSADAAADPRARLRVELQNVLDAKAAYSQAQAVARPTEGGHEGWKSPDWAVQDEMWEEVSLLRGRELDLKAQLSKPSLQLPAGALLPVVGPQDMAAVVSAWTGIPASDLSPAESSAVSGLTTRLKEHVVGQDQAVACTVNALKRAKTGLRDQKRPVAALMFTGPTGVGKTHLARVLTSAWFGCNGSLIQLDMSEYMERHAVTKLIGPPPGFEGYQDGGKLTEAVRRQPHCLLLLDELEKAHPDVCNLLLQILEDGRLTDAHGRTVSFRHALIIMTSNVGAQHFAATRLGFNLSCHNQDEANNSSVKGLVTDELKAVFRPELLNRMDEIVVFRELGSSQLSAISQLLLEEVSLRLQQLHRSSLQLSQRLMSHLTDASGSQAYGARPMKRAITRFVEDPLADAILAGKIQAGSTTFLDLAPDSHTVTVRCTEEHDSSIRVVRSEIVAKAHSRSFKSEVSRVL